MHEISNKLCWVFKFRCQTDVGKMLAARADGQLRPHLVLRVQSVHLNLRSTDGSNRHTKFNLLICDFLA